MRSWMPPSSGTGTSTPPCGTATRWASATASGAPGFRARSSSSRRSSTGSSRARIARSRDWPTACSAWSSTTSTCCSSTGRSRGRTSSCRPGRRSSSSRMRDWCARSASPTSSRSTSTGSRRRTCTVPAVNQIQLSPAIVRADQRAYHAAHGIVTESWSPFGGGRSSLFGDPVLTAVGERYGKTAAQVMCRWHLQLGLVVIPKSSDRARMAAEPRRVRLRAHGRGSQPRSRRSRVRAGWTRTGTGTELTSARSRQARPA